LMNDERAGVRFLFDLMFKDLSAFRY